MCSIRRVAMQRRGSATRPQTIRRVRALSVGALTSSSSRPPPVSAADAICRIEVAGAQQDAHNTTSDANAGQTNLVRDAHGTGHRHDVGHTDRGSRSPPPFHPTRSRGANHGPGKQQASGSNPQAKPGSKYLLVLEQCERHDGRLAPLLAGSSTELLELVGPRREEAGAVQRPRLHQRHHGRIDILSAKWRCAWLSARSHDACHSRGGLATRMRGTHASCMRA